MLDHELLGLAIANAGWDRRALVTPCQDDKLLSVAVQPFIGEIGDAGEVLALLLFGKQPVADTLRIALFAKLRGITAAEARILQSLCDGVNPKDIAAQQGVPLSTVRSHISSMRVKTRTATHTATSRDMVGRVAALPPVSPGMISARMACPKTRGEGRTLEASRVGRRIHRARFTVLAKTGSGRPDRKTPPNSPWSPHCPNLLWKVCRCEFSN